MIIGLTGSVGSGKSTAAMLLQDLFGAKVVDADAVVYRLQEPQAEGFRRIISAFGTRFIAADGTLDRKALASQVFSDDDELQKLNYVLHPLVWDELRSELKGLAGQDLVVLMVPLLFETGMDSLADITLLVTIDEAVRARRREEQKGRRYLLQGFDRRLLKETIWVDLSCFQLLKANDIMLPWPLVDLITRRVENTKKVDKRLLADLQQLNARCK